EIHSAQDRDAILRSDAADRRRSQGGPRSGIDSEIVRYVSDKEMVANRGEAMVERILRPDQAFFLCRGLTITAILVIAFLGAWCRAAQDTKPAGDPPIKLSDVAGRVHTPLLQPDKK